jgi:hypothetical protein
VKTRYDKLIVVRGVEARMATSDFAEAAATLAGHEALAMRLDGAATALSTETGTGSGADLAARLELSGRMHVARRTAQVRLDDALTARDQAATARKTSRRALDAAIDIRRAHQQTEITRAEAKAVPARPQETTR